MALGDESAKVMVAVAAPQEGPSLTFPTHLAAGQQAVGLAPSTAALRVPGVQPAYTEVAGVEQPKIKVTSSRASRKPRTYLITDGETGAQACLSAKGRLQVTCKRPRTQQGQGCAGGQNWGETTSGPSAGLGARPDQTALRVSGSSYGPGGPEETRESG